MNPKAGVGRAALLKFLAAQTERYTIKDMFLESELSEYAVRYNLRQLEADGLADRIPAKGTTGAWDKWALTDEGRAEARKEG